jgi:manganese/iron transport system ATP-binding protein
LSTVTAVLGKGGVRHEPAAPVLELRDVSVAYTGTAVTGWALEDVSFSLTPGQRVAVVGPNGAGKSTLFKLVAGTIKATVGSIDVYGHRPDGHICIAYVPQRNQIDWQFPVTVEEVVMMGRVGQIGLFRWPSRRDWQLVRHSLERVNALHLADKQIGELSGGQQQRVFIARALAQEAELLLLDEPLSGLDVPSREAIFTILDALRPDGVTVLLATHDLNLASECFDQVILLNRRIIAHGRAASVLTPANLLQAYGGHVHLIPAGDGTLLLADTCCDHGAE